MTRIAFLTLEDRTGYVIDDAVAIPAFAARGIHVDEIPWTSFDPRTHQYDGVIVRTTWDYQKELPRFLHTLESIQSAGLRLGNSLDLIRWNATKTYLKDLEQRGVTIVPTLWGETLDAALLDTLPGKLGSDEFVVKPVVGANADDTFRLAPTTPRESFAAAAGTFSGKAWMAQPFIRAVVEEGEYSLFYFGGRLSHAIVKRPKRGDFRVQEEHGGLIERIAASAALRAAADRVVATLDAPPLQARIDLVRLADGALALMELEAIEPSLYFRMDPEASSNFAAAVEAWLRN